jgi:hypothetical protein
MWIAAIEGGGTVCKEARTVHFKALLQYLSFGTENKPSRACMTITEVRVENGSRDLQITKLSNVFHLITSSSDFVVLFMETACG